MFLWGILFLIGWTEELKLKWSNNPHWHHLNKKNHGIATKILHDSIGTGKRRLSLVHVKHQNQTKMVKENPILVNSSF